MAPPLHYLFILSWFWLIWSVCEFGQRIVQTVLFYIIETKEHIDRPTFVDRLQRNADSEL